MSAYDAIVAALLGPKRNLDATAAPTASDDSTQGYSAGSLWNDTVGKQIYFCKDAAVGAAVWGAVPTTPSSGTNNRIALFDGTSGKTLKEAPVTIDPTTGNIVFPAAATGTIDALVGTTPANGLQIASQRRFPPSAGNPAGPAAHGDAYFDTALGMEMRYDGPRAKWLSLQTVEFHFGRDGNTPPGAYYRAADGRVMSATNGWYALYSGTIVGLGYTRDNSLFATFSVTANGGSVASLSTTSTSGGITSFNGDFSAGQILAVANGGNLTSNVIAVLQVRWRA